MPSYVYYEILENTGFLLYTCRNIHPGYKVLDPWILGVEITKWNLVLGNGEKVTKRVDFKTKNDEFIGIAITGQDRENGNLCFLIGTSPEAPSWSDSGWNPKSTFVILFQAEYNVNQCYKISTPGLFTEGVGIYNKLIKVIGSGWFLCHVKQRENEGQTVSYFKFNFDDNTKTVKVLLLSSRVFEDWKLCLQSATLVNNQCYFLDDKTTNLHCYCFLNNSWSMVENRIQKLCKIWLGDETEKGNLKMAFYNGQFFVTGSSMTNLYLLKNNSWSSVDITDVIQKFVEPFKQWHVNQTLAEFFPSADGNLVAKCHHSFGLGIRSVSFKSVNICTQVDQLKTIALKSLANWCLQNTLDMDEIPNKISLPFRMVQSYFGHTGFILNVNFKESVTIVAE